MSLRKSPQLTPGLLAAAHGNARHSTGPRTPQGKQNSKMNALKHGERADPENHYEVMRALGEDPQEFEHLKQELRASFGPGDAFTEKQVDDLARLYWRRERLERAQEGLMHRALLGVEEWQQRRRQEMERATFGPSQPGALDVPLPVPSDPGVRLRMLLSFLEVIRKEVQQRIFARRQAHVLEGLYQGHLGWRQGRVWNLLRLFGEHAEPKPQAHWERVIGKKPEPCAQPSEEPYQELLGLLEEEIAGVREEFEATEKMNAEKAAIEHDACLAPQGEEWGRMLRRESSLDRSIDRKIKLLLTLGKNFTNSKPPASTGGQGDGLKLASHESTPEKGVPVEVNGSVKVEVVRTKMHERSGKVAEEKGAACPAGVSADLPLTAGGPGLEGTASRPPAFGV